MRKIFSVVFLLSFTSIMLTAQRAHVVYAEVLGSGFLWSANYDVRFKPQSGGLGGRLGTSIIENFLILPLQVNYTSGKKHGFEAGIGATMFFDMGSGEDGPKDFRNDFCPSGTLMYRYQGPKGLNVRVGLSPFIPLTVDDSFIYSSWFLLWPGASVGYRF